MKTKELIKLLNDELESYHNITTGEVAYGTPYIPDIEINQDEFPVGQSHRTHLFENIEHKIEILSLIKIKVKNLFKDAYLNSKIENEHWSFCSFRTYKNTYSKRKSSFLDLNDDRNKTSNDFIESEIRTIESLKKSILHDILDLETKKGVLEEINKKIHFLNIEINNDTEKPTAPLTSIFSSQNAAILFERYYSDYISCNKNKLVELSFIYRKMYQDKLINEYIKPEMFKNYISKPPFELEIDHSLKTYDNCKTTTRNTNYSNLHQIIFKRN